MLNVRGFTLHSTYLDPSSGAVRVLYRADNQASMASPFYMVIKIFDREDGTKYTVKFWRTHDIHRSSALWNTKRHDLEPATWAAISAAYKDWASAMTTLRS